METDAEAALLTKLVGAQGGALSAQRRQSVVSAHPVGDEPLDERLGDLLRVGEMTVDQGARLRDPFFAHVGKSFDFLDDASHQVGEITIRRLTGCVPVRARFSEVLDGKTYLLV